MISKVGLYISFLGVYCVQFSEITMFTRTAIGAISLEYFPVSWNKHPVDSM